jgi:acetyl esterase/lipase
MWRIGRMLAAALAMVSGTAQAAPISFRDLLARPREAASQRIAYGADPLQFGELWLPKGPGPFPVAVLIHGGCWRADLPGLELMDYMAADLRARGMAVWNVEYRRLGGPGAGYPGTFLDVANGVDALAGIARANPLDLTRVVVAGHSAGGHLAVWTVARPKLGRSSPLHRPAPLPLRGAVSLAGILDLEAYRADGPDACGGPGTIDSLVAGGTYAETSPARMLPLAARHAVISGALDAIVPARFGDAYAARAGIQAITIEDAGHFELIDPASAAWPRVLAEIEAMLR